MISFLSFASPSASIAAFATTFAPAFLTNVSRAFKDWPVEITSSTKATLFPLIFCASMLFKYNFWEPLVVIESTSTSIGAVFLTISVSPKVTKLAIDKS